MKSPTETESRLLDRIERQQQWINDLQSGMYINCVYCGHRYGPREDTPVCMADVLKAHIEQCPEHPLSHAKAENEQLKSYLADIRKSRDWHKQLCCEPDRDADAINDAMLALNLAMDFVFAQMDLPHGFLFVGPNNAAVALTRFGILRDADVTVGDPIEAAR